MKNKEDETHRIEETKEIRQLNAIKYTELDAETGKLINGKTGKNPNKVWGSVKSNTLLLVS